jgi:hypothetical protein
MVLLHNVHDDMTRGTVELLQLQGNLAMLPSSQYHRSSCCESYSQAF